MGPERPATMDVAMAAGHGFSLLSASPLAFEWPGFATPGECCALASTGARLQRAIDAGVDEEFCGALRQFGICHGAPGFRRVYALPGSRKLRADFDVDDVEELSESGCELLRRFTQTLADFVDCEAHEDEDACVLNLTPGRSDGALLESGLHVDTYNDEPRRFATAILYLGDLGPEDGGQTVFPAAGRAPASVVAAGRELLAGGLESTLDAPCEGPLRAAAAALEGHAAEALRTHRGAAHLDGEALAVRPRQGSLLVFFTRGLSGEVDARSWHGSAAVRGEARKWTLQTFKAAPVATRDPSAFAAELVERHIFAARRSLPPAAFRRLEAARDAESWCPSGALPTTLGAQLLVPEVASLPGGVRLRLLSAHDLAGPLAAGAGDRDVTGLALWPAATTLAEHVVERERELVAGRRVLDVGCGAGLVGIAAAAVGAEEVVMIDGSPQAVELASRNAALNAEALRARGRDPAVSVQQGDWRDAAVRESLGRFGVVLAADVLYPPADSDAGPSAEATAYAAAVELLGFLAAVLETGEDSEALLAAQRRAMCLGPSVEAAAAACGLEARPVAEWSRLPGLLLWRLRRIGPLRSPTAILSELD